eukprot:PhM_4_TR4091/c1_g3_i7/m.90533
MSRPRPNKYANFAIIASVVISSPHTTPSSIKTLPSADAPNDMAPCSTWLPMTTSTSCCSVARIRASMPSLRSMASPMPYVSRTTARTDSLSSTCFRPVSSKPGTRLTTKNLDSNVLLTRKRPFGGSIRPRDKSFEAEVKRAPRRDKGGKLGEWKASIASELIFVVRFPRRRTSLKKTHTSHSCVEHANSMLTMRLRRESLWISVSGATPPVMITGFARFCSMNDSALAQYAIVSVPMMTTKPSTSGYSFSMSHAMRIQSDTSRSAEWWRRGASKTLYFGMRGSSNSFMDCSWKFSSPVLCSSTPVGLYFMPTLPPV